MLVKICNGLLFISKVSFSLCYIDWATHLGRSKSLGQQVRTAGIQRSLGPHYHPSNFYRSLVENWHSISYLMAFHFADCACLITGELVACPGGLGQLFFLEKPTQPAAAATLSMKLIVPRTGQFGTALAL